jgi:hypothetical protein
MTKTLAILIMVLAIMLPVSFAYQIGDFYATGEDGVPGCNVVI